MIVVLGFSTGNMPHSIPTTIVVHDGSQASQMIVQAISGSEYFSVSPLVSTEGEARQLLDEGKVKVIVEIPPNLQENLDNNIPTNIVVIVDESDSSISMTAKSILAQIISGLSSKVSGRQTPLLVYSAAPAYGTGRQALDFVIPALIAMTIFMGAVQGMGRAIAGEKKEGSLTRVFLTPTSNTTIIAGTLIFYVIFEMIRASLILAFAMALFGVKIEGSILLVGLVLFIFVCLCTSIGLLISAVVKTEAQFTSVAMLVSMPTMFLSGVFFPVQAMPKIMQVISTFLPITYASEALRNVAAKGLGFSAIMAPLGILLIFLVVILSLTIILFKRNIE
jgi:ABC-2 type transport system permease protein